LAEILRQLAQVRDADNHFRHLLPEGSLYLWQDRLHCVPDVPLSRRPIAWDARTPLAWSGGFLSLQASRETGLRAAPLAGKILQIRPRQGGEALRPAPNRPRRPLKHLLREARIPPWQRERLPLIYLDDEFLACPGVAIAADWQCRRGEMGLLPVFQQGG
ncbi:MAG: tRNA lysidine(34) synthetase TilS, partial [Zoogloeaceae bacterium]|nr:tRNA lysidine(34) synthetase TilS [Zoogloeaceae bacterium]